MSCRNNNTCNSHENENEEEPRLQQLPTTTAVVSSLVDTSRKRLRDTARPLVITAAYEVVSKVTGSHALAFGLVGGVYALAKERTRQQQQQQQQHGAAGNPQYLFFPNFVEPPSGPSGSPSPSEDSPPTLKKRRIRRSESILHMIDLLNPMSSFSSSNNNLNRNPKDSKHSKRKRIRSFPLHLSKKLWKLSTAPFEEKLTQDDNNSRTLLEDPSNIQWHECNTFAKAEVSSDEEEEEEEEEEASDVNPKFAADNSTSSNMIEASSSSEGSNEEASRKTIKEEAVATSLLNRDDPNHSKGAAPIRLTRNRSSSMHINPSAAFGVAGELCRKQMDEQQLHLLETVSKDNTRATRRRFLRSLYAHAGIPSSTGETYPLSTPLILATNFNIRSSGAWSDDDHFYSRISNPTRDALERVLATAEQGYSQEECQAACFGSGMAAVTAVVGAASSIMGSSQKQKGVHIVLPKTCYDESVKMIQMGSEGITSFIRVDMLDTKSVDTALAKHPEMGKVLFLETPDNPLVNVCDLQALVRIARKHDAIVIVDTTWSPPLVCQTFRFGVDAICFSCTKTMGGHSDALCGTVVTNGSTPLGRAVFPRVKDIQITLGGVASPFDSWLVLRGLRTMPVRMERMCATSMKLATFLENHPLAEWVRYPGLESHPQHELAKTQMDLFGQMLTWSIQGGSEAAMAFVGAVSLARRATSTGGTETLVQHQRSVEMKKITPGGIIRVSVGLEDADDLIEDFGKALQCVEKVCRSLKSTPKKRNHHHASEFASSSSSSSTPGPRRSNPNDLYALSTF